MKHDLLVLGSQNVKEVDQELSRDQIFPVQILHKNGEITPITFFNDWGKVGVSSMAWNPNFENRLFVSTNDEMRILNTKTGKSKVLDLEKVNDLHDIDFLEDQLWIANTEFDEAIHFDPYNNKIAQRISLEEFRIALDNPDDEIQETKDRFHCNQVFRDYNGDLCVLIHNISGWQFYRQVMETLIRRQGDGGIINLDKKKILKLKLQSPHSVRKINNEYWVQDSTDQTTKIFDRDWKLKDSISTGGFGRGVDFCENEGIAYIGISATRKRYLRVIPTKEKLANRIMLIDLKTRKKIDVIPIPNIEQLDNVYILDEKMKAVFENMDALID